MRVANLHTDAEFQTYADGFRDTIRVRSGGAVQSEVPLDYLRRCITVGGVFNARGVMIGGYAINATTPLRLLDFVPETARTSLVPPDGRSWSDCCELVCMWRTDELSASRMDRTVWPRIAWHAITAGKPYLLGHNQNRGLDKRYTRFGMVTLYEGPSAKGHDSRLFFYTRSRMATMLAVRGLITPFLMLVPVRDGPVPPLPL